jgi:Tol biopolymer transport system component
MRSRETKSYKPTFAAAVAVLVLAAGLASPALGKPHKAKTTTKRVSVRSNGTEVNADNDFGAVSGNGRFATFESVGKFTAGDDGFDDDVFIHDRTTGKTRRVSVKSNGKEVPGGSADDSSISTDGRYVAFLADGALVPSDANGKVDVYVKDTKTGKVKRASVKSNGSELADDSGAPAISGNGRYVAFDSEGPFVDVDSNGISDIFRHDMKTGKTSRVDVRFDGSQTADTITNFGAESLNPSISFDGNVVAYQSIDDTMTADPDYDNKIDNDIFVRNIKQGKTTRASLKANGSEADPSGNQMNVFPAVSGNGRFVAFSADYYGSFVPGDTNNAYDVYVKDLKTGAISRVSLKSDGSQSPDPSGADAPAAISADGQRIAFESYGQLVPSDSNVFRDIYLRDRKLKKTIRVSITSKNKQVDGYSHQLPAISADGHWVAFSSQGKFTGGDSGVDFDVFERGPLR